MPQEGFADDELSFDEPPEWRPPVACPACGQTETRLLTLHHEMSVYLCERCNTQFEVEE